MKFNFSSLVVIVVIGLNLWFTNKVLNIYMVTSSEPITLIAAWFAFTGGELWLLSGIKKSKIKRDTIEFESIFSEVHENMKGD